MYVIDEGAGREQLDGLGELDGWWTKLRDTIIKPVVGAGLSIVAPQVGIPLVMSELKRQQEKKAMEEAQRQADAASALMAAQPGYSVPSGDVALQRALAMQAYPGASVPSGDVALRRAMGGEDPDERRKRWLMYGAIGAGTLVTGALLFNLVRRR
jgi:hypothetical protein